jgi:site-specific DNA recombinase
MNVYGYTRVSAEYQADNTSPLAQRQNCIDWAERKFGVKMADDHILEEPGKTGANLDRPKLQELLSRLQAGDVVVVNTMDRLTRDLDNLFELRIRFKWLGVRAFSVTEKLEVTTASVAELPQVTITGLFSQMELERIVWRLQNGRKARMRQGEAAFGNTPPFGYKSVKRTAADGHIGTFLDINEEEAEVVRLIFKMLFTDDMSSHQIARTLNAMGVPSPAAWRGKQSRGWYSSRVRSILKSSTYYGIYTWGEIDVPVPSIVGPEDHMLAVRKLRDNMRFSEKGAKHSYLLRGLVRCALCKHTYTGNVVTGNKYYGCEGRKHPGKYNMPERCAAPHLKADDIEGWVWSTFVGVIDDPASIEQYVTHQNVTEAVDVEADLIVLESRIESLEREQVNLVRMRARGEIESDWALNQALDDVEVNLEATRNEYRRLSSRRQDKVVQQVQMSAVYERVTALQSAIHGDLPDDLRNELLRTLIDEIVVGTESIKMFLAAPGDETGLWQRTGCAVSHSSPKSPLVIEAQLIDIIR